MAWVVVLAAPQLVGCARAGLDQDPAMLAPGRDASSPEYDAGAYVHYPDAGGGPVNGDGDGDGDDQDAGPHPFEPDASGVDSGADPQEPDPTDELEPWPDNANACPAEAPSSIKVEPCIQVGLNCRYGQAYQCTCYFAVWTCED